MYLFNMDRIQRWANVVPRETPDEPAQHIWVIDL
jgi:hypothetical protein